MPSLFSSPLRSSWLPASPSTGRNVCCSRRKDFPWSGSGEIFTRNEWANALSNSVIIAVVAGMLAISVALPLALYIWQRGGHLGPGALCAGHRSLHVAARRRGTRVHGLLDLGRSLWPHRRDNGLPCRLPRGASPCHDFARSRNRRTVPGRGSADHGRRPPYRFPDGHIPACATLCHFRFRVCGSPEPERIHHRVLGRRVYRGDAADQDL